MRTCYWRGYTLSECRGLSVEAKCLSLKNATPIKHPNGAVVIPIYDRHPTVSRMATSRTATLGVCYTSFFVCDKPDRLTSLSTRTTLHRHHRIPLGNSHLSNNVTCNSSDNILYFFTGFLFLYGPNALALT